MFGIWVIGKVIVFANLEIPWSDVGWLQIAETSESMQDPDVMGQDLHLVRSGSDETMVDASLEDEASLDQASLISNCQSKYKIMIES